MIHFYIITPTFERKNLLQKNLNSVLRQDYPHFTHIIIDDSKNSETFDFLSSLPENPHQIFVKNEKNSWVNFSRNRGLDIASEVSQKNSKNYVVFLDDDDWFAPNVLSFMAQKIEKNYKKWYVSRRDYENKNPITKAKNGESEYDYVADYFLAKNFFWDATHWIDLEIIRNIRFFRDVKNAEEWYFFMQIAEFTNFEFIDHWSTLTAWYLDWGLTDKTYHKKIDLFFQRKMIKKQISMIKKIRPKIFPGRSYLVYLYYLPGIYHLARFFLPKIRKLFKKS